MDEKGNMRFSKDNWKFQTQDGSEGMSCKEMMSHELEWDCPEEVQGEKLSLESFGVCTWTAWEKKTERNSQKREEMPVFM